MTIPWIACEACGFRWFAEPPGECPMCYAPEPIPFWVIGAYGGYKLKTIS